MRYALLALLLMTGAAAAQGWPAVNSSIPAGRGTIGVQGYVANNTALKAAKGTDHTGGVHRQGFTTAGDGGAATYYWSASNCTTANDGTQVQPSVTGCWIAALGPEVDPVVFGADPTGIADSAPAIRAAIAASAHVKFSPGLYNLCSTQPSPYPNAINPTPILVQNKSNFVIDLGQARLKVCDAVVKPSNGTQTMTFDQVSNYSVIGGNFIGNQPTSSAVGLTGGICTMNAFGAKYLNQVFSGDWSSTSGGSAYCGDYIVDSVFSGAVTLDPVTAGFDFAFLQNVKIVDFNLRGKFGTGPGNSGVSVIYDGPMIGENKTGYTITDSTNVTIDGTATGFNAGWFIAAGSGYTIRGNYSGNVGTATQPAYGGIIGYNASGGASSVGHPPTNLNIGGQYNDNGNATVTGGGIVILSNNITNADEISGIKVNASFSNNAIVGIEATSDSHLRDVQVSADCRGTAQTACVGPSLMAHSDPTVAVSSAGPITLTSGVTTAIASLSLPAGKWSVSGQVGMLAGPGITVTAYEAAITPTALTFPCCSGQAAYIIDAPGAVSFVSRAAPVGQIVFNLGEQTTVYLIAQSSFSGGTVQGVGSLQATRL